MPCPGKAEKSGDQGRIFFHLRGKGGQETKDEEKTAGMGCKFLHSRCMNLLLTDI